MIDREQKGFLGLSKIMFDPESCVKTINEPESCVKTINEKLAAFKV